jgi:hypothetical protein
MRNVGLANAVATVAHRSDLRSKAGTGRGGGGYARRNPGESERLCCVSVSKVLRR